MAGTLILLLCLTTDLALRWQVTRLRTATTGTPTLCETLTSRGTCVTALLLPTTLTRVVVGQSFERWVRLTVVLARLVWCNMFPVRVQSGPTRLG